MTRLWRVMLQFHDYVSTFGGSCCAKMAVSTALGEPQPIIANCQPLPAGVSSLKHPVYPASASCFNVAADINNQMVIDY